MRSLLAAGLLTISLTASAGFVQVAQHTESWSAANSYITAGSEYKSPRVSFSYDVRRDVDTNQWMYIYTFINTTRKDLSHLIVETSGGLTDDNTVTNKAYELGTWSKKLPDDVTGIKWDVNNPLPAEMFFIITDRAPMWGDWYAKSGTGSYAHNAGYTADDIDPLMSALDLGRMAAGQSLLNYELNHVLVPDPPLASSAVSVAEPASLLMLLVGLLSLTHRKFQVKY